MSTTVNLPAGYATGDPLEMELTVPIMDDSLFEDTETFQVVLSSDSEGVVLGSPFIKTVFIQDNDGGFEDNPLITANKAFRVTVSTSLGSLV